MRQSPLLKFESTAFSVAPGEDDATNPGIFGKALAQWLSQQLHSQGSTPGEIIPEDFGWCVPLQSNSHKLYFACSSAEAQGRWQLFVFADAGLMSRLFGTDKS